MKRARTLLAAAGVAALGALLAFGAVVPASAEEGTQTQRADTGWNAPPPEPSPTPTLLSTNDTGWN
jgi:hypothetical protein